MAIHERFDALTPCRRRNFTDVAHLRSGNCISILSTARRPE